MANDEEQYTTNMMDTDFDHSREPNWSAILVIFIKSDVAGPTSYSLNPMPAGFTIT